MITILALADANTLHALSTSSIVWDSQAVTFILLKPTKALCPGKNPITAFYPYAVPCPVTTLKRYLDVTRGYGSSDCCFSHMLGHLAPLPWTLSPNGWRTFWWNIARMTGSPGLRMGMHLHWGCEAAKNSREAWKNVWVHDTWLSGRALIVSTNWGSVLVLPSTIFRSQSAVCGSSSWNTAVKVQQHSDNCLYGAMLLLLHVYANFCSLILAFPWIYQGTWKFHLGTSVGMAGCT